MKRFLSAGEGYALFRNRLSTNNTSLYAGERHGGSLRHFTNMRRVIGKRLLVAFFLFLCLTLPVRAQFHKPSELTIRIGEELPEYLWQYAHRAMDSKTGRDTVIRLADHREKLIILDFWASWCGPCIGSLNKLSQLKSDLLDEGYVILPVTYQSTKQVHDALDRHEWPFSMILEDETLGKAFPHSGLPHMVWIKGGRVLAMPSAAYATVGNIQAVLEGQPVRLFSVVRDKEIDYSKIKNGRVDFGVTLDMIGERSHFLSFSEGYISQKLDIRHVDGTTIVSAVNQLPEDILFDAFRSELPFHNLHSSRPGFVLEPPPDYLAGDFISDSTYRSWEERRKISFFMVLPGYHSWADVKGTLQEDLNQGIGDLFALHGVLSEGRRITYAVLRDQNPDRITAALDCPDCQSDVKPKLINGVYHHFPFGSHFLTVLNHRLKQCEDIQLSYWNLVNQSSMGLDRPVCFEFPSSVNNIYDLKAIVNMYGFVLEIVEGKEPIFEIIKLNKT